LSDPSCIRSYRRHKQSGQTVVTLTDGLGNRRDVLLGEYGTPSSRNEYLRVITEWKTAGRRLPAKSDAKHDITLNELMVAYWRFAEGYYGLERRKGHPLKYALSVVKELYGTTRAIDFGPLALKSCRQRMIDKNWSRSYTNAQVDRIRRMFRGAGGVELLPASVYQNLGAVAGLRFGKTEACETHKVRPVAMPHVEATLPFMRPVVQTMVQLQLLLGCRPDEVCAIRPLDLDMSKSACWVYRPGSDRGHHGQHKTAIPGHDRAILIGPKAQLLLRPYLGTRLDGYCFSPAASEAARSSKRHEDRKSPITPSQHARRPQPNRRRAPGNRYVTLSYRNAIYRACHKAFPLPEHLAPRPLKNDKRESVAAWRARLTPEEREAIRTWRREHGWHPNQLRHSRATELRPYGLDVVKTILGHSKLETTQVYSEKDMAAAMELVAKIG
jgi:integrase